MSDQLILTEREAADLLNVSPRTLFTLRTRNEIPYLRIGNQVRYLHAQLVRWVETKCHGGQGNG